MICPARPWPRLYKICLIAVRFGRQHFRRKLAGTRPLVTGQFDGRNWLKAPAQPLLLTCLRPQCACPRAVPAHPLAGIDLDAGILVMPPTDCRRPPLAEKCSISGLPESSPAPTGGERPANIGGLHDRHSALVECAPSRPCSTISGVPGPAVAQSRGRHASYELIPTSFPPARWTLRSSLRH